MIFKKQKFLVYSQSVDSTFEVGSKYELLQVVPPLPYDTDNDNKLDGSTIDRIDGNSPNGAEFTIAQTQAALKAWEKAGRPTEVNGKPLLGIPTSGARKGGEAPAGGGGTGKPNPTTTTTNGDMGIAGDFAELERLIKMLDGDPSIVVPNPDAPDYLKKLKKSIGIRGEIGLVQEAQLRYMNGVANLIDDGSNIFNYFNKSRDLGVILATETIEKALKNLLAAQDQLLSRYRQVSDRIANSRQNDAKREGDRLTAAATSLQATNTYKSEQIRATQAHKAEIIKITSAGYQAALKRAEEYLSANQQVIGMPQKPRAVETFRNRIWQQLGEHMPAEVFQIEDLDFREGSTGSKYITKTVPKYESVNLGTFLFERRDNLVGAMSPIKFYYIPESARNPNFKLATDLVNIDLSHQDIIEIVGKPEGGAFKYYYPDGSALSAEESQKVFVQANLTGAGGFLTHRKANGDIENTEPLVNYFFQANSAIDDLMNNTMGSKSQAMFGYLNNCSGWFENPLFRAQIAEIVSGMGEMGIFEMLFRLAMAVWQASCLGYLGDGAQQEMSALGIPPSQDEWSKMSDQQRQEAMNKVFSSKTAKNVMNEVLSLDLSKLNPAQFSEFSRALRGNEASAVAKVICKLGVAGALLDSSNNQIGDFSIPTDQIDSKSLRELLDSMPEAGKKEYGKAIGAGIKTLADLDKFKEEIVKIYADSSNEYKAIINNATQIFVTNNRDKLFSEFKSSFDGMVQNSDVIAASGIGRSAKPEDKITQAEEKVIIELLQRLKSIGINILVDDSNNALDISTISDIKVTKEKVSGQDKFMIEILGPTANGSPSKLIGKKAIDEVIQLH